jgi:hypothetical protein
LQTLWLEQLQQIPDKTNPKKWYQVPRYQYAIQKEHCYMYDDFSSEPCPTVYMTLGLNCCISQDHRMTVSYGFRIGKIVCRAISIQKTRCIFQKL